MDNILGLTLDTRFLKKEKLRGSFEVKTDVLSEMENIMLLQLNYVQIKGTYKKFPDELRWLCMHGFPLKSIPSDLALDNLVALDLSYSSIESFGMCWSNPQKVRTKSFHFIYYIIKHRAFTCPCPLSKWNSKYLNSHLHLSR